MKIILVTLGLLLVTGCSTYQYDANNPNQYVDHWCDPANEELLQELIRRQNKTADRHQYDQPEHLTDIDSKQRCIEKHQQSGDFDTTQ